MTTVPSFTYAGGELGPGLWGRVDLNKYQTGVKLARNFHVGVEGGLIKRVGLYFIGQPKHQNLETKLVRWRIADNDSYVLEFGDFYLRFLRFGGHVLYPDGHVPDPDSDAVSVDGFLEVPTPYADEHVRELKFTFANDVVYIFHRNYAPMKLTRIGLYDWSLEEINFNPHEAAPANLTAVWQVQDKETDVWEDVVGTNPVWDFPEHPIEYRYKVSATMSDGLETLASAATAVIADLSHNSLRVLLTWDAVAGAEKYTVYKTKAGLYGFIGYVDAEETLEFHDTNIAPSYDVVPVEDWGGFGKAVDSDPTEWPRVGQFYKQRLGYAATTRQPQSLWFSKPTHFHAMSTSIPAQDDDAIQVTLVGNERQTINHMIQLKRFIVFTDSGEWLVGAVGDTALSGATIDPVQETNYGSDPFLEPLVIGNRILFVQNISNIVRDMGYEFSNDSYTADDLSRLARHLFENVRIVAWSYSNAPNNVLWCVKDDGSFCAMTYVREHEIWAWTQMETEGQIIDVAVVPETDQDASYFLVYREINGVGQRFIERSEILQTTRVEDMFYVDCGLTYKDERTYSTIVRNSATSISIQSVGHGVAVGTEVQVEHATFDLRFTVAVADADNLSLASKYDKEVPDEIANTSGLFYVCTEVITGFDHLAGQTGLVALVDGYVVKNITIDETGSFTLDIPAARVHCGFGYNGRVETLDIDDQRAAGQYHYRAVNNVKLHLKDSRGVLAGSAQVTEHGLEEIQPRSDEDYDEPNRLLNGVFEIQPHTEWSMSCGVIVEAPYPLPCHILNIVPDVTYGSS